MASFELALTHLMRDEDPTLSGMVVAEPGTGKARFGVNSIANPQAVTDAFYEMPCAEALEYASILYRHRYFEPSGCTQLSDQDVVNLFFDLMVNQGIKEATKLAQRACNRVIFNGTEPF